VSSSPLPPTPAPELIIAAADAGVPVLCEKPVARTIDEGVAVGRRVAAAGVPVPIGYPRRFPTGKPYVFFIDRFAGAFRAELSAFVEVAARSRPSPCTIVRQGRPETPECRGPPGVGCWIHTAGVTPPLPTQP
jgi:GFO/IDH/MocA oxidoreductase family protein